MFRNYFKIALRNIQRNKIFSFINIFGLAVGMACSLLIFLFVKNELGYDRFNKDSANIYRVVKDWVNEDGTEIPDATTPPALAVAMQREIPEVISEIHFEQIFTSLVILAIVIACLGLFGLATFVAEQRTKEIGIRKVLGSSVFNIARLLALDFIKLVGISIIIATPGAWHIMNKWLEDYAYRVNISWITFFIATLLAIAIALITISFQSIKAAVANPVKSLRTE